MSVQSHPITSLKVALRNHLLAHTDVAALVGTAIFDAPPRGALPPYLVFGDAVARDNGTVERDGAIIELDLLAITSERGTAAALALVATLEGALRAQLPALADHRLVAIEVSQTATRHDAATTLTRATLRLRAFTEPL